jgi:RNA polymerase sigma-70 factor (ECF subfamily)
MSTTPDPGLGGGPAEGDFDRLVRELRPRLHRYCARMTGSVVDGEDVLQDALIKAMEARPRSGPIENPEGWLFRIAHNAALDHLRRRARQPTVAVDEEELEMIASPVNDVAAREAAAASLRSFMRLPASQRSAVILRDVLGYSIEEAGAVMDATIPAVKGALQRGRARLQEIAKEPEEAPPPELGPAARARLTAYVDRFNARDFDAVRDMLAADVRLELVNRLRLEGKDKVSPYFHRYAEVAPWRCVPGFVDGRPAALMFDPNDLGGRPSFFVLLDWAEDGVVGIRDFLFARYAVEGADIQALA